MMTKKYYIKFKNIKNTKNKIYETKRENDRSDRMWYEDSDTWGAEINSFYGWFSGENSGDQCMFSGEK